MYTTISMWDTIHFVFTVSGWLTDCLSHRQVVTLSKPKYFSVWLLIGSEWTWKVASIYYTSAVKITQLVTQSLNWMIKQICMFIKLVSSHRHLWHRWPFWNTNCIQLSEVSNYWPVKPVLISVKQNRRRGICCWCSPKCKSLNLNPSAAKIYQNK